MTKLYTNRDWYMTWLTSVITPKGGWDDDALDHAHFSPVKENSSNSTRSAIAWTAVPNRQCLLHGITPRLTAQTISGTVNPLVFMSEGDAALNCFLRLHVYVTVGDTDAVRGTLLNQFEDTVNEFATTLTAQRLGTAQTLTPVVAQDGDRIGIELGFVQTVVRSAVVFIGTAVGTRYLNGDATVGSTQATGSTGLNGYIEFSADLAFKPGIASEVCTGALVASTFPYTSTVDTTDSATVNTPNLVGDCSNWGDDSLPVWWKITIPAGRILSIHTQGSAYHTIVSLWRGACGTLTQLTCAQSPTVATPLQFGSTDGGDYYVLVNRDVYYNNIEATGPGGLVSIGITATIAPPHQCLSATTVPSIPYTVTNLDTTGLGDDLFPSLSCVSVQRHMKWFQYTPATSHLLYLSAAGTDFDCAIAIVTGTCPNGPWTQRICRNGTVATPVRLSFAATAGTTYWIVAASDGNPGGHLSLFFGDTHTLGLVTAGQPGAFEWEGNWTYHVANATDSFMQIISRTGGSIFGIKVRSVSSCSAGGGWAFDLTALEIRGVSGGTITPPLSTFVIPPICGGGTAQGHYNTAQTPPSPDIGAGYTGVFGIRFRLSGTDTVSGSLVADGYIEVRWPGSSFGTWRADNLTLSNLGHPWQGGIMFMAGWWTRRLSVRSIDTFNLTWDPAASNLLYFRDFTDQTGTKEEVFAEYGGVFDRVTYSEIDSVRPAPPLEDAPRIGNGREFVTYWPAAAGETAGRPTYIAAHPDGSNWYTNAFAGLRRTIPYYPPGIVFRDNFDDAIPNTGLLPPWGHTNSPFPSQNSVQTVLKWGYGYTTCVGCGTGQSNTQLPWAPPNEGAIRMQIAAIIPHATVPDGVLFTAVGYAEPTLALGSLDFLCYLCVDGSIRIRLPGSVTAIGVPSVFINTAPGIIPLDGTQHGLQIRFTIGATVFSVTFTVDNVDVGTITHTIAFTRLWNYLWLYGFRLPSLGALPVTDIITMDNYEADSSSAVIDWPAGTAPVIDLARICSVDPLPPEPPVSPAIELPHPLRTWRIYRLDSKPRQESSS